MADCVFGGSRRVWGYRGRLAWRRLINPCGGRISSFWAHYLAAGRIYLWEAALFSLRAEFLASGEMCAFDGRIFVVLGSIPMPLDWYLPCWSICWCRKGISSVAVDYLLVGMNCCCKKEFKYLLLSSTGWIFNYWLPYLIAGLNLSSTDLYLQQRNKHQVPYIVAFVSVFAVV